VIRRIADALDVTIGDLVAEPTLLEWTSDSGVRTVPALRWVLMDYRQLPPMLAGNGATGEPPSLDAIERDIAEVFDAYQASRYGYITGRVPLVLSDALHAMRAIDESESTRAHAPLALAYQAAVSVLTKLGETDLAWIVSERGLAAAQQSDNPVVLGSLFRSVTHALHATGRFAAGVQLVEAAAAVLQPHLSAHADEALLSVYGTLFLTGAVAASRADDRAPAMMFLREGGESAKPARTRRQRYVDRLRPDERRIHRMTTAMELGDVQAPSTSHPASTPPPSRPSAVSGTPSRPPAPTPPATAATTPSRCCSTPSSTRPSKSATTPSSGSSC